MTIQSDLSIFFSSPFKTTCALTSDSTATFYVIVDYDYFAVEIGEGSLSTYTVSFLAKQSDLTDKSIDIGGLLTMNSTNYKVVDIKKQGDGLTTIVMLQEV